MNPFTYEDFAYLAVELPDEILYFKYSGDFQGELRAVRKWLERADLIPAMRKRLELELVLASGMDKDYHTDFPTMLHQLQEKYPAVRAEHLRTLMDQGYADYILRGGEIRFQNDAFANILKTSTAYLHKIQHPDWNPTQEEPDNSNIHYMMEHGSRAFRYHVRQWIKPDAAHERPGEKIRAYLPFPAETPEQTDIRLLDASPAPGYVSSALQRTICFEGLYEAGQKFCLDVSFVNRAFYKELDPAQVSAGQPSFYTGEDYPHIRFTPYIRELCAYLRGQETNPLLIAQRFYDYITFHVHYSYMREYLFLENIPEYCARNLKGDCGVQALLFITLCRCAGIPAKWQSGNYITPTHIGSHDWAQFYIAPYGWLFADPSFGGGAARRGDELCRKFYFGNIDPFRYVANSDFQKPFDPPMRYIRIDPYDNQMGEIEYEDGSLTYTEVDAHREVVDSEELQ